MPQLDAAQLLALLKGAQPLPGILLSGADSYLRDTCRAAIIAAYVAEGTRDWALHRFSASDTPVERILGQASTLPMLVPHQVILVSDVDAWQGKSDDSDEESSPKSKSAADPATKPLGAYFDDPAPFSILVFETSGLDQRRKLAKLLLDKMTVVECELAGDDAQRARLAATMAETMAKDLGVRLDSDAAEELTDMLNFDLGHIHTELIKLATYAGDRKQITAADVDALVVSTKKYSVWQLADMLAEGDPRRAVTFLDTLIRDGEQAPALVGAMAWMVRKLIEAQSIRGNPQPWQLARTLRMRQETAALAHRSARRIPRARLLAGLRALYDADNLLKSGASHSQRAILEFLVSRLASRA